MQIVRRTIHLDPEPLGAWVSQSRTASAQREPSRSLCMPPWPPLLAGQNKASLSAVVPLVAPSKVSLLARSRVGSRGILVQATRLRGIQVTQRKPGQRAHATSEERTKQRTWSAGRWAKSARRGLTLRSRGAPTAGHQRPAGGTRYIFAIRALASCRRRPLNSNVRPRKIELCRLIPPSQTAANANRAPYHSPSSRAIRSMGLSVAFSLSTARTSRVTLHAALVPFNRWQK